MPCYKKPVTETGYYFSLDWQATASKRNADFVYSQVVSGVNKATCFLSVSEKKSTLRGMKNYSSSLLVPQNKKEK